MYALFFPAQIARSASVASPGPLTTHPITAILSGLWILVRAFLIFLARGISPTCVLPHVGQTISCGSFDL